MPPGAARFFKEFLEVVTDPVLHHYIQEPARTLSLHVFISDLAVSPRIPEAFIDYLQPFWSKQSNRPPLSQPFPQPNIWRADFESM